MKSPEQVTDDMSRRGEAHSCGAMQLWWVRTITAFEPTPCEGGSERHRTRGGDFELVTRGQGCGTEVLLDMSHGALSIGIAARKS